MNLLQMLQSKPLHLHHLVVTGSVIEGVASLREVVQHISGVKNRDPAAVDPGYPEKVVCEPNEKCNRRPELCAGLLRYICTGYV